MGEILPTAPLLSRASRDRRLGAILVAVVCSAYMLGWWNLYLSPMCGGDLFSMIAPKHGWLPYRDYYYQSPPGNILLLGWLGSLFGAKLVVPWAFHSIVDVAGAVGFYFVLLRFATPISAILGVVLAFVLGFGDMGDTPSWYFHQIATCAVFALLFLLRAIERSDRSTGAWWNLPTGLFLGWAFAVKQTMAPVALAFLLVPVVIALRRPSLRHWAAMSLACYCGGLVVVIAPVVAWLANNGILRACIDQAFLRGTSSKGPLSSALVRPFVGLVNYGPHRVPTLYAVLLLALFGMAALQAQKEKSEVSKFPQRGILILGFFCLVAMQVGVFSASQHLDLRSPALVLAGISSIGAFSLAAWASFRLFRDDSLEAIKKWVLLFVVAAHTYGATLGWAMGEVVTFPALGAIVAVFWAAAGKSYRAPAMHGAVTVLVLCAITFGTWRKMMFPASLFWWIEPPIWQSGFMPRAPELVGFSLSGPTTELYDKVNGLIQQYVKPGDEILSYPNMQVFYALADAKSPTLCLNHWFDICPDDVAIEDAKRLRARPPALIVAQDFPEYAYPFHETFFRQGKPSGQRVLWKAILDLVKDYKLVAAFPQAEATMKVWVREK